MERTCPLLLYQYYIYTHPFIIVSIIILDKYSLFFVIHGKMMFIITPPFKKMISHISSQCCIHIIVSCIYIYISMLSHKYIHGITISSNISIPYIPSHKYSLLSIIYILDPSISYYYYNIYDDSIDI